MSIVWEADRPHNDRHYRVDSTRLRKPAREPRVNFEDGMLNTAEWYARRAERLEADEEEQLGRRTKGKGKGNKEGKD